MQQVVSGDGPEVEFGGRLEEQLGSGGDAGRLVANGPDAQAVEVGLELGTQAGQSLEGQDFLSLDAQTHRHLLEQRRGS